MARKRASMREGPLAELFKATEAAQRQQERGAEGAPAEEPHESTVEHVPSWEDEVETPAPPRPDPIPEPIPPEPEPQPSPCVRSPPIWIFVSASEICSCCMSVLTATNSTWLMPASIIRLTAFRPAPPTPTTWIFAR